MSKKRKLLLIGTISVIVLSIGFLIYYVASLTIEYVSITKNSNKIVSEFNEIYESDEKKVILFASPTCGFCKKFVVVLNEIKKEEKIDYYYLNVTALTKSDRNSILDKLDIKINGVPHLIVLEEKQVIGELSGYNDKERILEFFKRTNVIEGDV